MALGGGEVVRRRHLERQRGHRPRHARARRPPRPARRRRWRGPPPRGRAPAPHAGTPAASVSARSAARSGVATTTPARVDLLDGVGDQDARDHRRVTGAHLVDQAAEQRSTAPGSGLRRAPARCRRPAAAPRRPAATESVRSAPPAHDVDVVRARAAGRDRARLPRGGRRARPRHVRDLGRPQCTLDGVLEQRPATQGDERLGLGARRACAPRPPATRTTAALRRRGPRRGWPRPCPRSSSRREPARRRGSGGPWRACASRRRTGHGPCPDATGRGRPRPP